MQPCVKRQGLAGARHRWLTGIEPLGAWILLGSLAAAQPPPVCARQVCARTCSKENAVPAKNDWFHLDCHGAKAEAWGLRSCRSGGPLPAAPVRRRRRRCLRDGTAARPVAPSLATPGRGTLLAAPAPRGLTECWQLGSSCPRAGASRVCDYSPVPQPCTTLFRFPEMSQLHHESTAHASGRRPATRSPRPPRPGAGGGGLRHVLARCGTSKSAALLHVGAGPGRTGCRPRPACAARGMPEPSGPCPGMPEMS